MKVPLVDLKAQYNSIKQEIDAAILEVIEDSAFIGGKYVADFERVFAQFCGARYCVGVGNGTDALYITFRALGIGQGDEVITAANSFIATSEAVSMTGARVIFVDCDTETYNIDTTKVSDAITSATRAIIPVHLYGQPAKVPALIEIAKKHSLHLIEDAAQAHGAEIQGKRVGTFGRAACFSFYPGKNLGAYGDGGAVVTNDKDLALKIRKIANHGRLAKYDHELEGLNSRLDGLQAAILSAKLKHLEEWTEKRRAAAIRYRELLRDSPIICPVEEPDLRHVYHLFVVRVRNRERVREKLREKGISTGIHYPIPLPNLKAYRHLGYKAGDFPVAAKFSKCVLSLPMFPEITEEQLVYVSKELKKAVISLEEKTR
ncbi:erythromycin biosynthesis sensory transduction protein eryC1 [candidate division WOR-1 bacterium DG_54_3]|uniref:Erythromycin biosynthesis sensory transduction protein eryC1 n=1 Tax=candidate division WOR-1 bacterium DG_54_3 TaxID=1703775 RepID=A0A0S7XRS0_UNCSA|nr:MAG: erythromycin biosynthesis sensory transduction protein eryC1 [candidate division WOR-1 bacterium DG_54_3]